MTSQNGHFEDDPKGPEKRTLKGWVQNDLGTSLSNAVEQEIVDPLKNFAHDIEWLASGGKSKPSIHATEKKKETPNDLVGQATDFGVYGTVSAFTYSVAGYLTQAASRRFGTAFKLGGAAMKVLDNRFTGQVLGAGIHDFYLNADDMKGRVANAVGGATTMAVYDGANHLLPGKCRFTKAAAQPFIGAASAASGYYASTKVDGREIKQEDFLHASGEGAAFGTVFPVVTWGLGKFGGRFQPRRSGSFGEASAHTVGAETGPKAKAEVVAPKAKTQIYKGQVLEGRIEKNLVDTETFKTDGKKLSPTENSANANKKNSYSLKSELPTKTQPKSVEGVKSEGGKPETRSVEVKETEAKKAETKEVEVKETETKKSEAKEVEVKETETKKSETKEVEVKETETKKSEAKEVEVKETETKKSETKEVEVKETETKKSEAKEVEVKETETKKSEAKEVEVKETETKKSEAKEVEVKETETKKSEAKEVDVKETETKKSEAKEVEVKETETKQAAAKDVETIQTPVQEVEVERAVTRDVSEIAVSADVTAAAATNVAQTPAQGNNQASTPFTARDANVQYANPLSAEKIAAFESKFGLKSEPRTEGRFQSKYGVLAPNVGVPGRFTCYALPLSAAGGSIVAAHSAAQNTASNDESISATSEVDLSSLLQMSPQEASEYEKFRRQLPDWMDELGFRVGLYSPPSQTVEALTSPIYQATRRIRFAPSDQTTTKFTRIVAPSFSQALKAAERGHGLRGPSHGVPGVLGGFDAVTVAQYEEIIGKVPELYGRSKHWMPANEVLSGEVMFRRYPFLTQDSRRQSALLYSAENSENASVGMMGSGGNMSDPVNPDPSVLSAAASQATNPASKQ